MTQGFCLILLSLVGFVASADPHIRIHQGTIGVQAGLYSPSVGSQNYVVGSQYTFEIYMDGTATEDYVIESCTMNGASFIGQFGCVLCGTNVLNSVETEQYTLPGAIKRTLVHFKAPATSIEFRCQITVYQCTGCAERSCERRPSLIGYLPRQIPLHCGSAAIAYPTINAYPVGMGAYPTGATGVGYAVARKRAWAFPWWLWLLLALLLLLLILCCILCCLAAMRRRRAQKTTVTRIATVEENKGVGIAVGTEKVTTRSTGVVTGSSIRGSTTDERVAASAASAAAAAAAATAAAAAAAAAARNRDQVREERIDAFRVDRYETNGNDRKPPNETEVRSGIYSTRDARIAHDRHDRDDRYINSNQNDYSVHRSFNRHHPVDVDSSTTTLQRHHGVHDRASYRNFAYERDMGRVAPLSGFDEVETTERRLCLSDDECDIVEKDIKRTHTTRFVQETRVVPDCDSDDEKYREEGVQHAVYAQSLPV